ncbi:MAG: 30S ribosomal protein S5 [Waddliaceae bacterium]|nr:30S ribosomal protein S5 [Waddliaceae bacterium]
MAKNNETQQKQGRKDKRPAEPRKERDDEIEERVLFVNRCAKVVKGGRKFSFSALIVVGDHKGKVGYGFAKANELTDAIRKAGEIARKGMITFEMEGTTIPHELMVNWDGARVLLKPAAEGTGLIAGSKVRSVLELAGVKDAVVKSLGSNNPMNLVHATFKALKQLKNRRDTLLMRGVA